MLLSVALIAIDRLVMPLAPRAEELTASFPFREALLQAILGTLLFAAGCRSASRVRSERESGCSSCHTW